jgi:hypothetical protein
MVFYQKNLNFEREIKREIRFARVCMKGARNKRSDTSVKLPPPYIQNLAMRSITHNS